MRSWFQIQLKADEGKKDNTVAEIHIVDFIGDWIDDWIKQYYNETTPVTAKSFVEELAKLPDTVQTIRVHINSPGGDVFGAVNIANALRDQRASKGRTVETIVDGIAASAASLILMAGDPVRIADNGLVMIHDPWSGIAGNSREMRKAADTLDKFRSANIVSTYQWHSKLSAEEIIALMEAETWMDADEAIANGFATEKIEGIKAAASVDPRASKVLSVPEKYKARFEAFLRTPPSAPVAATPAEILRLCREGDCLALAEGLYEAKATVEQVTARINGERDARASADARAKSIRSVCAAAKVPELADGYVAGGMTEDQVRQHLTIVTAKLDKVDIDNHLDPDHGSHKAPAIDASAIYAARNRTASKEK